MNYELKRVKDNIERFHINMEGLLVGETVFARYNNKMYRVAGIDYSMTPDSTFTMNNGSETTLKNYFEKQYNLVIRAARQPVLVSEGKVKQPNGAPQYAYLLPELCYPTGLTDAMRKDFRHMRELSRHTRLDPEKRRQTTEKLLTMIHQE
ncbi:PAZ domain protein [Cooperia oncophora]